jgi:hypothetical protein
MQPKQQQLCHTTCVPTIRCNCGCICGQTMRYTFAPSLSFVQQQPLEATCHPEPTLFTNSVPSPTPTSSPVRATTAQQSTTHTLTTQEHGNYSGSQLVGSTPIKACRVISPQHPFSRVRSVLHTPPRVRQFKVLSRTNQGTSVIMAQLLPPRKKNHLHGHPLRPSPNQPHFP